jgi:hypothetical protein
MRRWLLILAGLALIGAGSGLFVTRPQQLSKTEIAALPVGNVTRGETVFWAGGCASCHATPKSEGEAHLVMAGGVELKTDFGTFVAPNISSSPDHGIVIR